MTTQEEIDLLESRQIEVRNIMADSDAHASKAVKLGVDFAETYPEELAAYQAANTEYHENAARLEELYEQRRREEEERPVPEPEEEQVSTTKKSRRK